MHDGFDPAGGAADRDAAIERVDEAAAVVWRSFMFAGIVEVATRKPFFITDDVERLRLARRGPSTHENRALGPLMLEAQRQKICVPTDDWVQSAQRVNHRRWMRVWFSLVYDGPRVVRPRARKIHDPRQYGMIF